MQVESPGLADRFNVRGERRDIRDDCKVGWSWWGRFLGAGQVVALVLGR